MEDCFVVCYDEKALVVLRDIGGILPLREHILDWYAKSYAFERRRLSGGYLHSVSCEGMKYEDFTGGTSIHNQDGLHSGCRGCGAGPDEGCECPRKTGGGQ